MFQGAQSRHYTRKNKITQEQTILLKINTQEKHKQYGLQHSMTRTIHSAHRGKFISMAKEGSLGD